MPNATNAAAYANNLKTAVVRELDAANDTPAHRFHMVKANRNLYRLCMDIQRNGDKVCSAIWNAISKLESGLGQPGDVSDLARMAREDVLAAVREYEPEQRPNRVPLADVGATVTLNLQGRRPWTGTVTRAHSKGAGMDLLGKRNGAVSVIRNLHDQRLRAIIGDRSYVVTSIA